MYPTAPRERKNPTGETAAKRTHEYADNLSEPQQADTQELARTHALKNGGHSGNSDVNAVDKLWHEHATRSEDAVACSSDPSHICVSVSSSGQCYNNKNLGLTNRPYGMNAASCCEYSVQEIVRSITKSGNVEFLSGRDMPYRAGLAPDLKERAQLESIRKAMCNDHDIMVAAVTLNGMMLQFASDELKGDREVVLAATKGDTFALGCASDELKTDPEFMILVAKLSEGVSLQFASDELKNDPDFIISVVKMCGVIALNYASKTLLDDAVFMLRAIGIQPKAVLYASERLDRDHEFLHMAIGRLVDIDIPGLSESHRGSTGPTSNSNEAAAREENTR